MPRDFAAKCYREGPRREITERASRSGCEEQGIVLVDILESALAPIGMVLRRPYHVTPDTTLHIDKPEQLCRECMSADSRAQWPRRAGMEGHIDGILGLAHRFPKITKTPADLRCGSTTRQCDHER